MSRALDGSTGLQQTRVRAGLNYAYAYGDQPYNIDKPEQNTDEFKIRLQLVTLLAAAELPSGSGAAFVLPTGRLRSSSSVRVTDDMGIGDAELRVRQDLGRLFDLKGRYLPRLVVSLGSTAPTGTYVSKLDLGKLPAGQAPDKNLSLGRGAWWLLADAEIFGPIADRLGYYLSFRTRSAINNARDGFAWGDERQYGASLSGTIVPKLLSASASMDYLSRAMPTEIDYFGDRVDSASIGGEYLDATASLRWQISDSFAADLTGKKPVWRKVSGIQTPPNYWVFVGLTWNTLLGDPPKAPARPALRAHQPGDTAQPEIAALLVAGKTTIVDYWATWCAPCLKLGPQLDQFVKAQDQLALAKIDASDWDQANMDRLLPAVPGLPVVDIYTKDGKLSARLCGEHAFDFAKYLPQEVTPTVK